MRLLAFLILALGLLVAPEGSFPAARAETAATLGDFAGSWVGRSTPGSDRERAATLVIEPRPKNGFRIEWDSFEADRSGDVTRRGGRLAFRPSKAPGVWLADVSKDPFETLAAWAVIEGRALLVSTVSLRPDGRLERQLYRRTLTPDGLALSYRRWLDQDLDREIEAEFLPVKSMPARRPR